jgi:4-hydroxybenzoate polyprenyltransferase
MIALIESMRPRQWTKNLFVFAGIIFAQEADDPALVLKAVAAFALFCLLSGAVYLLNDLVDLEQDRRHPLKSKRPLASGRLHPATAVVALVVVAAGSLVASFHLTPLFGFIALGYFALQVLYSLVLKHQLIMDVFSVAIGFLLRAVAGAAAIDAVISPWLVICTVLLSLFLALGKRRQELVSLEGDAGLHRGTLRDYTPYLLDQMISVATASTVVSYCLYTMWPETIEKFGTHNLVYTTPFVLFGVFRYLYLIHQKGQGDSPDRVLVSDIPLLVSILLWMAAVAVILYGHTIS